MNILLVEDDELNRDSLKTRFERRGFHVAAAVNGEQAVQMAQTEKPDIILMDLGLPIINGLDATRKIKSNPETSAIPIIALTAHAMAGDRENAIAAGCDEYDSKPVDFELLLKKINTMVYQR